MKILYVSTVYPPDNGWGGIGTYAYHIAQGMHRLGHDVYVLCGVVDEPYRQTIDGVTVARELVSDRSNLAEMREEIAAKVESMIRDEKIDLVEFGEYSADGIVFQERNPDFPTVVRLHANSKMCALAGVGLVQKTYMHMRGRMKGLLEIDRLERKSAESADLVTSPSHWLSDFCVGEGWKISPRVIANPILVPDDGYEPSLNEELKVVSVARLCTLKGVDQYAGIINRVCGVDDRVTFDLVGQDTGYGIGRKKRWSEWLKKRIKREYLDRVNIRGGVPHHEIEGLLRGCDIAYFNSVFENFPYSHLEAMVNGLYTVVGSNGGAQELGEDGCSVVRVVREPGAIAEGILGGLRDQEKCLEVGRAGCEYVREHYHAPNIAKSMMALYESIV
ncbi:Glycosyl transferases group 1 [Poriferisphaera corsica]|uniref:Glycosyl transferases group 1 n=1 Tax=Poriferisphaera corsica TaxID=2528020 RepID=A0A517YPZ4_9BACT|nr:glycosyltransferase family 4 protein [Poriferisphaera corsica]QDU32288.1 Glycosyl transferases group 1 [Poriferisphaera corsica]